MSTFELLKQNNRKKGMSWSERHMVWVKNAGRQEKHYIQLTRIQCRKNYIIFLQPSSPSPAWPCNAWQRLWPCRVSKILLKQYLIKYQHQGFFFSQCESKVFLEYTLKLQTAVYTSSCVYTVRNKHQYSGKTYKMNVQTQQLNYRKTATISQH